MQRHLPVLFCMILCHAALNARIGGLASPRSGLEISCSLSDRNTPLKEYTILILEDDSIRDTIFADLAIPIYIQLDLNKSYVIEFSKPGFLERLVLIDTKVPEGKEKRRYTYDFEIDMPYALHDTGMYAVQPVARIIYDSVSGAFNYDKEYAQSIGNVPQMTPANAPKNSQWPLRRKSQTHLTRKSM